MKFKLDENFDLRLGSLFVKGGHSVDTVRDEKLSGQPDDRIYQICKEKGMVLVTLDLDFSNPLRFQVDQMEGIIVVRPKRPVLHLIRAVLETTLPILKAKPLKGRLWIAEHGRIRLYDPFDEGSAG